MLKREAFVDVFSRRILEENEPDYYSGKFLVGAF